MYLLEFDNYGEFNLVKFVEDVVPHYAVISHTWGQEEDEVTFGDVMNERGKNKAGYSKIEFCKKQATCDTLKRFWFDTCCIDKSSAAELSESINSMFRWYQNATKCYVLLTDVSKPSDEDDRDSQLRNSRWFTRGWTLQELIAPQCVEFFSREHQKLGDKKSLEQQLQQITHVPIYALRGEPLSRFSVAERLSWIEKRSTKRREDMAYSLLGIFDISMPAIYGEGERNAFRRLRHEIEQYSNNHLLDASLRSNPLFFPEEQRRMPETQANWIVPFERNTRFTGRDSELAWLEAKLFNRDRTAKLAITGLGGVGKTQLVLELIWRFADKHKHYSVIWIAATNLESLHQSYLDAARQLKIPGFEDERADVKNLVQEYLTNDAMSQWLLVFDNADDLEMWMIEPETGQVTGRKTEPQRRDLIDYVPRSKQGAVVFTTRNRKTATRLAPHNIVELSEMSEEAAVTLLTSYLHDFDFVKHQQDAISLVTELTCLPLAIVQAAAYINQTGITLSEYLSLLSEQEEEVVDLLSEDFEDDGRYRSAKNPVMTTWLISFEQIERQNPLAVEYLSFMACIEPKAIPQMLLPPALSRKKQVDAIGALNGYSFVTRGSAGTHSVLNMHRLVHLAMRNWLSKTGKMNLCISQALRHLAGAFPIDKHENQSLWRSYLPHVIRALTSTKTQQNLTGRTTLLEKVGMCLHRDGRYVEAEIALEEVTKARDQELGSEHPDTLRSMNGLASALRGQGNYEASERMSLQALEGRKKTLGAEHLDTAFSMNSLAIVLQEQGKLEVAEKLIRQALDIRKKHFGFEHRDSLFSMNSLAIVLRELGNHEAAHEMIQQSLTGRIRILGPEHPETLSSMNHLALILRLQGKFEASEKICRQALEGREKVLGIEHPITLRSMSNLVLILQDQEKYEKAEEICLRVLEGREKVLGTEHPETLQSSFVLATLVPFRDGPGHLL